MKRWYGYKDVMDIKYEIKEIDMMENDTIGMIEKERVNI